MSRKKAAEILRIATAPPVLIILTLALFYALNLEVFSNAGELAVAVLLLGVFPALAYPVQAAIPKLRAQGRDAQRKLAFCFTLLGYTLGLVIALFGEVTEKMSLIYVTYFNSVVFLTVVNKCFHEKASGHACSTTGTLIFAMYYIGAWAIIPCVGLFSAMAWSSVKLGRHTSHNIVTGTLTFIAAFFVTLTITMVAMG